MSLAFANRSAALFYLGDYRASLADIELAVSNQYPLESLYKLEDRRAKCYMALRQTAEAIRACELAIEDVNVRARLDPIKTAQINRDLQRTLNEAKSTAHYVQRPLPVQSAQEAGTV